MSEKLKPCPFCGCENIDHNTSEGYAFCVDCGVMVDIDLWNTRTESKQLADAVEIIETIKGQLNGEYSHLIVVANEFLSQVKE